jgi:hypothetical protein
MFRGLLWGTPRLNELDPRPWHMSRFQILGFSNAAKAGFGATSPSASVSAKDRNRPLTAIQIQDEARVVSTKPSACRMAVARMVMRTAGQCLQMRRDRRRLCGILMLSSSDATGEGNKQVEPRSNAGIDPGAANTIMSVLTGAWAARLVHTAAELGIADHLADGPRGVK